MESSARVQADVVLRDAIGRQDMAAIQALLVDGVDITTVDDEGMTPLMLAAKIGSPEMVEILLKAGADFTLKDKLGYTAEMIAYWYGEYRMGSYTAECLKIVEQLHQAAIQGARHE